MKSTAAFAAAALLSGADAFWRMPCTSRTGLGRIDPLVEPDEVASHAHTIHGSGNFGWDATYDDLVSADCTSCLVTQDKSAYWTPPMYFVHENGKTEIVKQVGGMLAYYLLYGEKVTGFPAGFRMLAGDTRRRNITVPVPDPETSAWGAEDKTQAALEQKALGFNCMNYGKPGERTLMRHGMPTKEYMDANCVDGIRTEVFFPSCWNGEKDSDDHKSHLAYPDLVIDGTCPEGFDKRVPSMLFETIWDTNAFNGKPGQFVFANGDPTGYGYHGDFIMGWDEKFLQDAVDQCTNPSGLISDCPLFNIQSEPEASTCNFTMPEILKKEDCAGPSDGLCGNVPIQYGEAYASALKPGKTGEATGGLAPKPTEAPEQPTVSYIAATSAVTDKFGGGISVLAVDPNGAAPVASDLPYSSAAEVAAAAVTTTAPPAPAAPALTPAPSEKAPVGKIISTSTYTSAGIVYEVAIEEIAVTVTVEADGSPVPSAAAQVYKKRHAHHHHLRRDREHGLLGRY
ncbi:hypothetical protein P154DRAFT_495796 [Amniculicola lignicola CBS 123094]|uniref:DUF1996 domain-containing protein n=1 Tax=Amniculicola lignicola CBS 123094 TaxID=1392246 RepID=A0A6A5WAL0_9PLEO|nr:hypothetical protein P154DRAFT_495796 [Amniculicola lignicola CBS 123094]